MVKTIRLLARLILIVGELIGVIMIFIGLYNGSNVGGVVMGWLLFPLFIFALPIMYLFNGEWTLFLLIYGSAIAFYFIDNFADRLEKK